VPVTCNVCRQNFCLKHRFETSHNCQGPQRCVIDNICVFVFNDLFRTGGRLKTTTTSRASSVTVKPKPSASHKPQNTTMAHIGAQLNRYVYVSEEYAHTHSYIISLCIVHNYSFSCFSERLQRQQQQSRVQGQKSSNVCFLL